jgi:hypothetical protein
VQSVAAGWIATLACTAWQRAERAVVQPAFKCGRYHANMKTAFSARLHQLPAGCLLLLLGLFSLSAQASLYCGSALVKVGDPQHRVARACPQPFYQEPLYSNPAYHHAYGTAALFAAAEVWYLNFGSSKLMRRLVFSNGYLQRIDELGYGVGFAPGSRRCSARDLANAGSMTAEIFAHCGAPDYVYAGLPDQHYAQYYGHARAVVFSRWIYVGHGDALDRELLFQQGQLIAIKVLSR